MSATSSVKGKLPSYQRHYVNNFYPAKVLHIYIADDFNLMIVEMLVNAIMFEREMMTSRAYRYISHSSQTYDLR